MLRQTALQLHAAVRGRHSGDGAGHHGYVCRACHLHRHPCNKELCASTTSTAPTAAVQSPAWDPCPCASEPQPATEQPKSSPSAYSDEDSAEPRALHSDFIEDMARTYFSDPPLEQNEPHDPREQRMSDDNTMFHAQVHTSASTIEAIPIIFASSSTEQ